MKRILGALVVALVLATSTPANAEHKRFSAIQLGNVVELQHRYDFPLVETDVEGDSHTDYILRLVRFANKHGLYVKIVDMRKVWPKVKFYIYGYYDPDKKQILLNINQSPNSMFNTFVHELAHHFQPERLFDIDKGAPGQVFAQAVAELVCQGVGLDTLQHSIAYVRQFPDHFDVFQRYSKEIEQLVEDILKDIA